MGGWRLKWRCCRVPPGGGVLLTGQGFLVEVDAGFAPRIHPTSPDQRGSEPRTLQVLGKKWEPSPRWGPLELLPCLTHTRAAQRVRRSVQTSTLTYTHHSQNVGVMGTPLSPLPGSLESILYSSANWGSPLKIPGCRFGGSVLQPYNMWVSPATPENSGRPSLGGLSSRRDPLPNFETHPGRPPLHPEIQAPASSHHHLPPPGRHPR